MGRIIDLAIVIPTLNEETYIGKLLDSIYSQTIWPKELVIVDAQSQDKTEQEVKKFKKKLPQLKFYQIPKYTIARQRNLGAKKTLSSHILFLDADTVLVDKDTLEKYFQEVEDKNPGLAVAPNYPLSDHWKDKILFEVANAGTAVSKHFYPLAVAINLYIKRNVFETLGGFNEKIKLGEDCELVQRYAKSDLKYTVLKGPRIYTSVRRIRKEGRIKYVIQSINSIIGTEIYGYRKNPAVKKYEFGKFGARG
jgi:glycosyltransferase involved in cell wall biosynthesis